MSLTIERGYTALIALWVVRHMAATVILPEEARPLWLAVTLIWVVCAIYLIIGRRVSIIYGLILVLLGLEFLAMGWSNKEGVSMLAWLTLVMAVTVDHDEERTFLIRMIATVVYAFAAITKTNPSWLAGEGILALVPKHPTISWTAPFFELPGLAVIMAIGVIVVEAFIAVGLWLPRTRNVAMFFGVMIHAGFVGLLARNVFSFVHLLALNGGLVLCYLAFRSPRPGTEGTDPVQVPVRQVEAY